FQPGAESLNDRIAPALGLRAGGAPRTSYRGPVAREETRIMWLASLRNLVRRHRPPRPAARDRRRVQLRVKQLEDRSLPSVYTAGSVADLIADINAANAAGGSNTIALVAGATFTLTAVNNSADGATGLPVIAANDTLTIVGNGDTIARKTAGG